jgi:outer membrane receptor for ferrienterochelin and colicin
MHSMKRLAYGAGLLALSAAMSSAVFAQETTSSLRGSVTANGVPVSGAAVTVVHTPSGTRSTTVSGQGGVFDARGLRVGGPYTVTVSAAGQPTKTFTDIYLTLAETFDLPAEIAAQEVAAIEITATRRAAEVGTSTVLSRDSIESVVSITRDIRDLARRDPLSSQNLGGNGGIAIAGSNPRTNRITIDGVAAQDPYGLDGGGLPTSRGPIMLDAIEQFSIASVPTDVENGAFSGGAINMVLRSGGNNFHGSLFVNYLNEGLVGRHIGNTRVPQVISQKNYGATLSGPIIQDKLFFALAYETYSTSGTSAIGPAGEGFTNSYLNGLGRPTLDLINNTFNNTYASDYDLGGILKGYPIIDRKYSAKLDWNINDQHRASLTYRYAESGGTATGGNSQTIAAFYSNLYLEQNIDQASTFELNSDWTDKFSTTFRATYRDWERGQNPPGGQNFSEISVCGQATPDATLTDANQFACAATSSGVRFGPDFNRHANQLNISEANFALTGRYTSGINSFKFGYQGAHKDVYNVFIGGARGTYYFDSVADFQAGRANRFQYINSVTGNPSDAAALFDYWVHSFFAQDTVQVSDTFKVTAGARFDYISLKQKVGNNPNFQARNGFSNTRTVDGEYVLMPRVSAEWRPTSNLKFTAGLGLFSGGYPEVLFATPFYNNGYQISGIEIRRLANGQFVETSNTPGFTQAVGAVALNNLQADPQFGHTIPGILQQLQQGALNPAGPLIPVANSVVAMSPSFRMPGEWKASLNATWRVWDGWNLTLDYVRSQTNNGISYRDFRAQPLIVNGVQQVTPDGRLRYDALTATAAQRLAQGITSVSPASPNFDLVAINKDLGDSWTAAVGVSKSFDFGLDFAASYARQNLNELNGGALRGTTGSSLYQNVPAGFDPAEDAYGRGTGETRDFAKLEVGYRKKFFGDNETRVTLFGERYSGRAFGFAMNDTGTSGRNATFGTARFNYLLYVPDIAGDSNTADLNVGAVTFATAGDRDRFLGYVKQFNLGNNRILEKNSNTNKDVNRLDLQISQELPSIWEGHKFKILFDIKNVLNLIDRDWGKVSEYGTGSSGGGGEVLARAQCADAAGAAIASTSAACPRYLYSNVPATVNRFTSTTSSLWYAQVTLKYEF